MWIMIRWREWKKDNLTLPLTPNHLLHGQIGGRFAPEVAEEVVYSPKKRWHRAGVD